MSTTDSIAETLRGVRLLATLDDTLLERVASAARVARLPAGHNLYRQDDPADELAVVLNGRLAVELDVDGSARVVRLLGAGAAIGELALLTNSSRSATVRAVRDSELVVIGRAEFDALMSSDGFAAELARSLAADLRSVAGRAVPEPPATVFAVFGLDRGASPRAVGAALLRQLEQQGSCALLNDATVGESAHDDDASYGAVLHRAESEADHVVLLTDDSSPVSSWRSFCLRSADRVLAVAGGGLKHAWLETSDLSRDDWDLVVHGRSASIDVRRWTESLHPRARHVLYEGSLADEARMARRLTGEARVLVLSGGGARGLAHIGVVAELSASGVVVDHVGGCSMGALVASMFGLGWPPDHMEAMCRRHLTRRLLPSVRLPAASLLKIRRASDVLHRVFGDTRLEQLPLETFTVASDLLAGELVVDRWGAIAEAVGASMAVPGLFAPIVRDGRLMIDGGVLDNLPVDVVADQQEGKIVAVDVMRRPDVDAQSVGGPVSTIARAMVLGSWQRTEANRSAADTVISPRVDSLGFLDFDGIDLAIAAGRDAARSALESGDLP